MSASPAIRERAYQIWRLEGTDDRTTARLRDENPRLSHLNRKTVARWREEGKWEKTAVNHEDTKDVFVDSSNGRLTTEWGKPKNAAEAKKLLQELIWTQFARIKNGIEGGDLQQAIQLTPSLIRLQKQIQDAEERAKKISPEILQEVVRRILAALNKVGELRSALNLTGVNERFAREVELEFGEVK